MPWKFNPFTGTLDWTDPQVSGGTLAAINVTVDISSFSKNLSGADINVQHALNTLDQLVAGGGGITVQQAIMYAMIGG